MNPINVSRCPKCGLNILIRMLDLVTWHCYKCNLDVVIAGDEAMAKMQPHSYAIYPQYEWGETMYNELIRSDVAGGGYEPRIVRLNDLTNGSRMHDAILKHTSTFIMRSRGNLLSFACAREDKLRMANACSASSYTPTLYMVWPGIYQSHLFIFDTPEVMDRVREILDDRRARLELEIEQLVEKRNAVEEELAIKRMEIRNL